MKFKVKEMIHNRICKLMFRLTYHKEKMKNRCFKEEEKTRRKERERTEKENKF
jgi:hypothetical protein